MALRYLIKYRKFKHVIYLNHGDGEGNDEGGSVRQIVLEGQVGESLRGLRAFDHDLQAVHIRPLIGTSDGDHMLDLQTVIGLSAEWQSIQNLKGLPQS